MPSYNSPQPLELSCNVIKLVIERSCNVITPVIERWRNLLVLLTRHAQDEGSLPITQTLSQPNCLAHSAAHQQVLQCLVAGPHLTQVLVCQRRYDVITSQRDDSVICVYNKICIVRVTSG